MRLPFPAAAAVLLAAAVIAPAQPPEPPKPATPTRAYPAGEALLAGYFDRQVKQIADGCLTDLTTKEDWEKRRPELRRQYFEMMGLWPLPSKTDLKPVVTGKVEGAGYTVEKLHFQSWPGLYVTANLYLPNPLPADQKLPTILYVCGHGNVIEKGVWYGSKTKYQYHPAWFATHGYACLILDTLQLSEIPGLHHGTTRYGMWWWQARGYTPAGVECWNAVRALDYLETRPEVDAKRIGVTGRSGGGAATWWILAADDRPQAFVPVAGIGDLYAHLVRAPAKQYPDGMLPGHCDCMYPVNTYRWDFPLVAALAAPRPLLLGNSDDDPIFPVDGYRRIADKVRKVYSLYGPAAEEKFQLLETKGPHVDTPQLRIGINRWMNRWLKGDTSTPVADDLPPPLPVHSLKVLDRTPEGAVNATLHELFVKPATHELPMSDAVVKEWWGSRRDELLRGLTDKVFGGWPKTPPPLTPTVAADVTADGVRLRRLDFVSEDGVVLDLWALTPADGKPAKAVYLSVLDDAGWEAWCKDLGPAFAAALRRTDVPTRDDAKFAQNKAAMAANGWVFAAVAPRGVGPTRWAEPNTRLDTIARRKFALIGQTLDGQRAWDVRRAVAVLPAVADLKGVPVTLQGEGQAGLIALFAGLFEPAVVGFDLWHPPAGLRDGPTFLNVAKVLDAPQAVALAAPRPVTLHLTAAADRAAWDWPLRVQKATGGTGLTVKVVGE